MALTEIYVDPSIAADSGSGTIGDPYGDLEYAIEQNALGAGGTRLNIKSGTAEVLAAQLDTAFADTSTTAAWTPTETAQVVIQGYTSAAGDGGKGEISGGGSVGIIATSRNYINFVDIIAHNCGSENIINLNNFSSVIRCKVGNSTGFGVDVNVGGVVRENYIYGVTGSGIIGNEAVIAYNDIHDTDGAITSAIACNGQCWVYRNLIWLDNASANGINSHDNCGVESNSIYQNAAGTGAGIYQQTNTIGGSLMNNLIQGFSGSGGDAIRADGSNTGMKQWGGNSAYDCESNYPSPALFELITTTTNEALTRSPFADAPNRDFAPVDTGSVKEGAVPAVFGDGQG